MFGIQKQGGFTVIEVTIFLAVSALLLTIAFIGTGAGLSNIRFTDSGRSVQSYIQKQYDEILNGVNTRSGQEACANSTVTSGPSSPQSAGASNCLLLGKLIDIKESNDKLNSYYVVGSESSTSKPTDLKSYDPRAVTGVAVDTYNIPWQSSISGTKRQDNLAINSLLFIRSPALGDISTYTFYRDPSDADLRPYISNNNTGKLTNICLASADIASSSLKITVGLGSGQDSIGLDFNTTANDCNGA